MIFDLVTFVVTFVIALVLYPPTIRVLRRMKAGQIIQDELPESHQKKAGTPTAGRWSSSWSRSPPVCSRRWRAIEARRLALVGW